jgi:hypothetical protein
LTGQGAEIIRKNAGHCGTSLALFGLEVYDTMTKTQNNAISAIARAALGQLHGTNVEFKGWWVKPGNCGEVYVSVTVGYEHDDTNMLSVLCRPFGLFQVGPRGRIVALGIPGYTRRTRRNPLIFGFKS